MDETLKMLSLQIKESQQILNNAKGAVVKKLIEITNNEDLPLFDRWCIFMEYAHQCLPASSYILSKEITDLARKSYDLERYQTYVFSDLFEDLWTPLDEIGKDPELDISVLDRFTNIPESTIRSIINSGYCGFECDW